MEKQDDNPKDLDEATRDRLAKLANVPVDTVDVQRRIEAQMPKEPVPHRKWRFGPWFTMAMAACLALMIMGWMLDRSHAMPVERVAAIHANSLAGKLHITPVADVQQANQHIAGLWPQAPLIPTPSEGRVTGCCIEEIEDVRVACLHLVVDNVPVSMVVCGQHDLKEPAGSVHTIGQRHCTVTQVGGYRMVTTTFQGRMICFIADLPESTLIRLASKLI